ncbi:MAG: hypothetical protein ACM3X8_05505 [Methanomicrobiales archaeon]
MKTIILIMLAALSLGAAVSAAYPVELTVTSDHVWMVADNRDTVTITANVTYGTGELAGQPLEGASLSLTVGSPWKLKDSSLVTDQRGIATTTLLPTTKSGTATITVTAAALIPNESGEYVSYSTTKTLSQDIDHTGPASAATYYNGQVQVRTATPIAVLVRDRYGNPVDNRNIVETVKFDASSRGISGFQSGGSSVKSITVPVNASGYATVLYFVDPPGTNSITITPPSPLPMKIVTITGLSQARPFSAASLVSPGGTPYPYTTVKTGQFTIGFTFLDEFGYPTMNQPVEVTTSVPGESMSLTTNKNGMVIITYGPKDVAGVYILTATAANNHSVTTSPKVEFVSGTATDALLTASPLTMASRDVKDDITSLLTMRVTDSKGNPVGGETVRFRFSSLSTSPLANQTMSPVLENGVDSTNSTGRDIVVTSNMEGEAVATFHPGAFSTDFSAPGYNATATGSAVVEARWSSVTRQLTLSYLNYPYLTVQSWVTPATVRVNETVDVMVKVTGDGWALQPKPIDVMLLSDRSGSMSEDLPDRAVSVIGASQIFSSKLDYSKDRLGLVSFGGKGRTDVTASSNTGRDGDSSDDAAYALANYPGNNRTYSDYATTDLNLTSSQAAINNEIPRLVPGGYTPMRYVLKVAIDQMMSRGRPNVVKALILLSDGDYNWYGDPLAVRSYSSSWPTTPSSYSDLDTRWMKFAEITNNTQQNMAQYARANNIKIFTIGFAQGISSGGQASLQSLATQTGGRYYYAPTADMLAGVYTDIAGSLKDTAGVNTGMNLSFQSITVNGNVTPGDQVYSYVFIDGHSTLVDSWNTSLAHLPGYPASYNSTDQWITRNRNLNFSIGTVQLGQVWQSTITLRVLKDGSISVFDPASKISMQDSTFPLKIPEAYFTSLPNNSANTLMIPYHLSIENLQLTNAGSLTSADIRWSLTYNGLESISEDVMIAEYGTMRWDHLFQPLRTVSNVTTTDAASIPLAGRGTGYYTIRVDADADDANPASTFLEVFLSDAGVRPLNPGETPLPGVGATPVPPPKIKIS